MTNAGKAEHLQWGEPHQLAKLWQELRGESRSAAATAAGTTDQCQEIQPEGGLLQPTLQSISLFALQVPSGGVRLVGLSHTARNNAMV